jgi:iron complex outermembrane receptor protein
MDDCYFQPGGNPDLKAERGFTYDGGLEWKVSRRHYSISGKVAAFDSRINDWILWTPTVKGYWSPSNVKKVHNYGTEATVNGFVDIFSDWRLKAEGSFAWTPSKNVGEKVNSNDTSYGKQLCYIPKISSSLAVRLEWKGFALSYKFCHYSERFTTTSNDVTQITGRLKPYYMSNLSLEKHFSCKALDWSVKGVVSNLFNTEYVTVLSRPMPRRNYEIFIDIRPKFGKKK